MQNQLSPLPSNIDDLMHIYSVATKKRSALHIHVGYLRSVYFSQTGEARLKEKER